MFSRMFRIVPLLALCALCWLLACVLPARAEQTVKKNTASALYFLLQDTSGNAQTGKGASVVVKYSVGTSATQSTGAGTVTEIGIGYYAYLPVSTEFGAAGPMLYDFTASGCVDYPLAVNVRLALTDDIYGALPPNLALLAIGGAGTVTFANTSIATVTNPVALPASVVPAGDVTTIANASASATLSASVASGVSLAQALMASMRNLKSNQAALNTTAHTRVVTYFVPGTSDTAVAAGTGTALFTATVHYASDNNTILYTSYN